MQKYAEICLKRYFDCYIGTIASSFMLDIALRAMALARAKRQK
ncbi:hypothetical protein [Moorena sp. SIO3A2]|nr:hypothetical protein [Moorena sp. SIO3A2]